MNLKTRLIKLEEKIEPNSFLVFYDPKLAAADAETQLRYCLENGFDKNKVLFANDVDMALQLKIREYPVFVGIELNCSETGQYLIGQAVLPI